MQMESKWHALVGAGALPPAPLREGDRARYDEARLHGMQAKVDGMRARVQSGDLQAAQDLVCLLPNRYRGEEAIRFYELWQTGDVSSEVAWEVLSAVWIHDHHWLMNTAETLWGDWWWAELTEMFRQLGPGAAHLPDSVTFWRGGVGRAADDVANNLSWTLTRGVACWFASRFASLNKDGVPFVIRVTMPRYCILAHLTSRGEDEVIVDVDELCVEDILICDDGEGLASAIAPDEDLIEAWRREGLLWKAQTRTAQDCALLGGVS